MTTPTTPTAGVGLPVPDAELAQLLADRLETVEVDHREHLPDLHGRAAHLAELVDELVDEGSGALTLGGLGPLRRPHAVGGAHPRPAHALAGDQPADARRAGNASGRQLPGLFRRILGVRPHTLRLATVSAAAGRPRAR